MSQEFAGVWSRGGELPVRLFYSYSHDDEDLRQHLEKHLRVLQRAGFIAQWHDRRIAAGANWQDEIDHNLASADIILLLVSASFIASDYCWGTETKKALDRHERGEARVIPVILSPCRWQITSIGKLKAVPKDGKPVSTWPDRNEAFLDVERSIEAVVNELRQRAPVAKPSVLPPRMPPTPSEEKLPPDEQPGGCVFHYPRLKDVPMAFASIFRFRKRYWLRFAIPGVLAVAGAVVYSVLCSSDAQPSAGQDGQLKAGSKFQDCGSCPKMVVVPAGAFDIGSPDFERSRRGSESPRHKVTFKRPFAIGRYEVTFDEWKDCADAGGCGGYYPLDSGWGEKQRPVIMVSWNDAQAYVQWLTQETKREYRLPTEAEWEYVARAGTTTRYPFGAEISNQEANFGRAVEKTTEVGAYPANKGSLHDVSGNVKEWVEDDWHDTYNNAPNDGSAWMATNGFQMKVLRGGAWDSSAESVRLASRDRNGPEVRSNNIGFRVAATLGEEAEEGGNAKRIICYVRKVFCCSFNRTLCDIKC